jgi:pectinesterase
VSGDVDFIWGYCDTALFEKCTLHTREDNRGKDRPAYVLQSRALNGKPGFVFVDCDFTAENRGEGAEIFIGSSQGTGKPDSIDRWDSIALVNCRISENYDAALWTDEDGSRAVYPEKGSTLTGWRQFGTKIVKKSGEILPYDEKLQEKHGYTMTEAEAESLLKLIK